MAIALVASTSGQTGAAATTHTAPWPVGYTPTAGHVAVVLFALPSGSTSAETVTADPPGWIVGTSQQGTTLTAITYIKPLTGGDAAPTMSVSVSATCDYVILVYSGVDTTTPFIDRDMLFDTSSTTTASTPILNNTDPNAWAVTMYGARQCPTPASWTPAPGMTERQDFDSGRSGNGNVCVAGNDSAGPIATGNVSYAGTMNQVSTLKVAWLGILRPAGGGGSGGDVSSTYNDDAGISDSVLPVLNPGLNPPEFVGVSHGIVDPGASASVAPPTGLLVGDMQIAVIELSSADEMVDTPPNGWTEELRYTNPHSAGAQGENEAIQIFTSATDTGTTTFTKTGTVHAIHAVRLAYRNVRATAGWAVLPQSNDNTRSIIFPVPDQTTTEDNCFVLAILGAEDALGPRTFTSPAGFTERYNSELTSEVLQVSVADTLEATPATESGIQFSASGTSWGEGISAVLLPSNVAGGTVQQQTDPVGLSDDATIQGHKDIAVNQVAELDAAQTTVTSSAQAIPVAQVVEYDITPATFDEVLPITVQKQRGSTSINVLLTSESDTALALGALKSATVGQVAEADHAVGIGTPSGYRIAVAQVTEQNDIPTFGDEALPITVLTTPAVQDISVVQTSELDAAQAITPTVTRRYFSVSQISEAASANSFTDARTGHLGVISESNQALVVAPTVTRRYVGINQVVETDSANAFTDARADHPNLVTESDQALVVTPTVTRRYISANQVAESDTAQAFGAASAGDVNQIAETSAVFTIVPVVTHRYVGVGQATETDTVRALSTSTNENIDVALVTESGQAFGVTRVKANALSLVSQSDTAPGVSVAKSTEITQTSEADSTQAIVPVVTHRYVSITQVSDSDASLSVSGAAAKGISQITETDFSATITATVTRRYVSVDTVTETDEAQIFSSAVANEINQVNESDLARAITPKVTRRYIGVGTVSESDSTQSLALNRGIHVTQTAESDAAQTVTPTVTHRYVAVGQVAETGFVNPMSTSSNANVALRQTSEADQVFSIKKTKTSPETGRVSESDAAQAIVAMRVRVIGQVAESGTVESLGSKHHQSVDQTAEAGVPLSVTPRVSRRYIVVGQIGEANSTGSIGRTKSASVTQVAQTGVAESLRALKALGISEAVEADSVAGLSRRVLVGAVLETGALEGVLVLRSLGIGQVTESDDAQVIHPPKKITIGLASTVDAAMNVLGKRSSDLNVDVTIIIGTTRGGSLLVDGSRYGSVSSAATRGSGTEVEPAGTRSSTSVGDTRRDLEAGDTRRDRKP